MLRIELRNTLDQRSLDEILDLLEEARRIEGHAPVGEHKASHLAVGAHNWVGILAYDEQRLVGYAHTRWNSWTGPEPPTPRLAVEVVVHPDWYDAPVARHLLAETRAVLGRAGGGLLYLWVHRVEDAHDTLAARLGFAIQRQLAYMTRDLESRPSGPVLPEGVVVRAYRPGQDDAALLAVNNRAFEGHPENGGWTPEELAARRSLDWFDPEGLITAWRGEELLGFHWTKWHGHTDEEPPAHEPVGEVYVLAVDPAAQGLGLGRALLDAGLGHLYDRGCRRAILYVDTANAGAVRLYSSQGFRTLYQEVCYEEQVWPTVDHQTPELLRPSS